MTKHKEPADVAVLAARIMLAGCGSYSRWRDDPSVPPPVSPYTAASLAERLCAIERAQRRHAEKDCNGEYDLAAAQGRDRGYVKGEDLLRRETERIAALIAAWRTDLGMPCEIELAGDPRGCVLLLKLPGEPEAVTV